jgi:hypothetical protein
VDVRTRPPGAGTRAQARAQTDAAKANADARPCDNIGCPSPGICRAPKSRERMNEYWWFCEAHAGDYNRRWNFFSGMTDDEFRAFQEAEFIGHRPTWTTKPSRDAREAGKKKFETTGEGFRDDHELFGEAAERLRRETHRRENRSKVVLMALEVIGVEEDADSPTIRRRYTELVKKYHPDSNGGDRAAEERLQRVIRAYQTLKTAGVA